MRLGWWNLINTSNHPSTRGKDAIFALFSSTAGICNGLPHDATTYFSFIFEFYDSFRLFSSQ
jgi:hypothetical protein